MLPQFEILEKVDYKRIMLSQIVNLPQDSLRCFFCYFVLEVPAVFLIRNVIRLCYERALLRRGLRAINIFIFIIGFKFYKFLYLYRDDVLVEDFKGEVRLLAQVFENLILMCANELDSFWIGNFDGVVILFLLRRGSFDRFAVGVLLASGVCERGPRVASGFSLGAVGFVGARLEWLGVVAPVLDQHGLFKELVRLRVVNDDCVAPRLNKVHVHKRHPFLGSLQQPLRIIFTTLPIIKAFRIIIR